MGKASDGGAASEPMRQQLRNLHKALLHLHKALLNIERGNYESVHGKVSSGQLLQLVISDRQFTWLRSISELIVRLDELEEADDPPAAADEVEASLNQLRGLLDPQSNSEFGQKYDAALKKDQTAMTSHLEVRTILDREF